MIKPVQTWLLPDGVADVLPEAAARLEHMRRRQLDLLARWGYDLVFTPLVEHLESLLTGTGTDLEQLTFKLMDPLSGRLLGVRADITPQVARLDAHRLAAEGVARYCYVGTLLQARSGGLSDSRCPVQIGAELFGHEGVDSDLEIVTLMLTALTEAGAAPLHLELGHVGIFRALARAAQLSPEVEAHWQDVLQRKALPEWQALLQSVSVSPAVAAALAALPRLAGQAEVLAAPVLQDPDLPADTRASLAQAQATLLALTTVLTERFPAVTVHVDLAEVRGYHYHTGVIFAAFVPGMTVAIAQGGRYDRVGEAFGRARPATGFSADLHAWAALTPSSASIPSVWAPAGQSPDLHAAIAACRAQGLRVIQALTDARPPSGCDRQLVQRDGRWQVESLPLSPT